MEALSLPQNMGHRAVFRLSWPIMVSMLSYTVMTVVDTLYVGRLGTEALASIGLAVTLVYLGTAFPNGLLSGVRVLTAQRTGAGDARAVRVVLWQGVWLALGCGVIAAGLAPVGRWVFPLMGASPDVASAASGYYAVRALSAPLVFLFTALAASYQGRGDTRTPMVATVSANVLNVAIDPVLIFGAGPIPALGVEGAAWATLLGMGLAVAVLLFGARRVLLGGVVGFRLAALRGIWRIGMPQGVQYLLDVGSFGVFAALLASSGDAHLAAHVVVVRIILMAFLPCHALGEAAGVLVGQALGARRPELARAAMRLAARQGVAIMVVMGIVFVSVPDALTGVFGVRADVATIARDVLLLYAVVQVFDALATVMLGALVGAGDTRFVLRISVLASWGVKLPIATVLVLGLDLGALGAWSGMAAEILFLAAVTWIRVRGDTWLAAVPEPAADPAALSVS